jgi:unsaturated pyranuronate lyase
MGRAKRKQGENERAIGVVVLTTLLLGAMVTGAFASIPDSSGVIHACPQPKTGAITKVINTNAGQTCAKNERPLNWNQAGPRGPVGPAAQVSMQTRAQRFTEPDPSQGQIGGGFATTATCPAAQHAVNGGPGPVGTRRPRGRTICTAATTSRTPSPACARPGRRTGRVPGRVTRTIRRMGFIDPGQLPVREPRPGFRGRFFHSERMTFAYYTIAAGASVHPHRHANDEVWHILDGEVEATVGGQVRRLRAGQAAVVPPDVEHSVRAVTDSRAIVVDSPTRDVVGGVDIR